MIISDAAISYSHSSLSAARRCLTEYDLRYLQQLERMGDDREVLKVGDTWHKAHEARSRGLDPYAAINAHAPSMLWAVKLGRLFAAYEWYWQTQPHVVIAPEREFSLIIKGRKFRGKIDARIQVPDGRIGLLELKTTADSVDDDSGYWAKLRMDIQTGLYALAEKEDRGILPAFVIYDATRKPTINPKKLAAAEVLRMRKEISKTGFAQYWAERFTEDVIGRALTDGREDHSLYAARLTADIGDRPQAYFARRHVPRSSYDYDVLIENLTQQVNVIEFAKETESLHRNPDSCNAFGTCDFFPLCSNNIRTTRHEVTIPNGFRRRDKLHPELS